MVAQRFHRGSFFSVNSLWFNLLAFEYTQNKIETGHFSNRNYDKINHSTAADYIENAMWFRL